MKQYILNVLIAVDQFFNALFLGDPDETISSRLGKIMVANRDNVFTRLVCLFLDWLDPGHCEKSIEADEGDAQIL